MKPVKLAILLLSLGAISSAAAQGTSQSNATRQGTGQNGLRYPSATQPTTNNPFQNPIGQGVAPATNANPARNNSQVSVPATGR